MASDGHFIVTERLRWVLDIVNRRDVWAPCGSEGRILENSQLISSPNIEKAIRSVADRFSPIVTLGFEIGSGIGRARIRDRNGDVHLFSLAVETGPPHRITELSATDFVPRDLPPRLPMDFSGQPTLSPAKKNLFVVFSGLPGVGKSTFADAAGLRLGIPVFNADWLLGSLTPFGGYHITSRQVVGAELLTTLTFRQVGLGQSAIVDYPAEDRWIRNRWRSLAEHAGVAFKVVVCTCSDMELHRRRLESRRRNIPGWHDGGNWPSIERRLAIFPPWEGDILTIDTVQSYESNLAAVLGYLGAVRSTAALSSNCQCGGS